MKKKILALLLMATVVGAIPVSAYASSATEKTEEAEETITNHEIITEINDEGREIQVGERSPLRAGDRQGRNAGNQGAMGQDRRKDVQTFCPELPCRRTDHTGASPQERCGACGTYPGMARL